MSRSEPHTREFAGRMYVCSIHSAYIIIVVMDVLNGLLLLYSVKFSRPLNFAVLAQSGKKFIHKLKLHHSIIIVDLQPQKLICGWLSEKIWGLKNLALYGMYLYSAGRQKVPGSRPAMDTFFFSWIGKREVTSSNPSRH